MTSRVGYTGTSGTILAANTADVVLGVDPNAQYHQISFTVVAGSPNAGVLTVYVVPRGTGRTEALTSGGAAVTIPMTANYTTQTFTGCFDQIVLDQDGNFNGTSFRVNVAGS